MWKKSIIAFTLFATWFGNEMHFRNPGVQDHPADIWGTPIKGGVIVPVIHTLLLTVLAMTIERWMALKTATGTGALPKFVANIKAALNANDFAKAEQLCSKQRRYCSQRCYGFFERHKSMSLRFNASLKKKAQKVKRIQQAHARLYSVGDAYSDNELAYHRYNRNSWYSYWSSRYCNRYDQSFQAMGEGGGADSAALIGISEALINTAFGILTSWCAVVSHNTFHQTRLIS